MKNSMLMPCADWVEKLAVKYPDDLSYAERVALNEHLVTCSTCATIHSTYQVMGARISNLPPVEPLPGLPYELLQREKCSASNIKQLETTYPGILCWLKALSEILIVRPLQQLATIKSGLLQQVTRIGMAIQCVVQSNTRWLSLLEEIHAAVDYFHQRVIYVSSDDHHLYAFRSDNSSILWQYKKSHVFFSSPGVKNGVAYLTSFDTQMFLFRARIRPCGDSFLWK
jgi:hypothetical protein